MWLLRVFVVKTFEGVLHVRQHGQVDLASCVVPIYFHAKVSGSAPVVGDGIVFLYDGYEVVGVLFAGEFNSEIFHTKGKSDGSPLVGPEARDKGALDIAFGVEPLFIVFSVGLACCVAIDPRAGSIVALP